MGCITIIVVRATSELHDDYFFMDNMDGVLEAQCLSVRNVFSIGFSRRFDLLVDWLARQTHQIGNPMNNPEAQGKSAMSDDLDGVEESSMPRLPNSLSGLARWHQEFTEI